MLGSTHSPGARGVVVTSGAGATSTGSGSGLSGISMSSSSISSSMSSSSAVSSKMTGAGCGEVGATTSRAPSGTMTKGFPCQSDLDVRAVAAAALWRARPTEASDTPVAMRIATSTTATRRTAAPAVPRPECRGRPTMAPR